MIIRSHSVGILLTLTFIGVALPAAQAQVTPPHRLSKGIPAVQKNGAVVRDVFGKVEMKVPGRAPYMPLSVEDTVSPQTTIRTRENSAVLFFLPGGHYLRVGAKSVVQFTELGKNGTYAIKLLSGQVWSSVNKVAPAISWRVTTPSATVTTATTTGALFAVGYDLEGDRSIVSTDTGAVDASPVSWDWKGTVKAGQYIPYLRRPQPNIRLRAPEVLDQDTEQKAMWKLLRQEPWTKVNPSVKVNPKMNRNTENPLQANLHMAGGIQ